MSVLKGKKVLLGVSGGIAAYKTASLVRLLIKAGAQVQVVMTPASKDFVTPLTLSALSKNPVYATFFDKEIAEDVILNQESKELWNNHVDLGLWGDLMLIAPATANTMSKMANGTCDNLLLAVYLSSKCPVYFAPAMDLDMFKHPSTLQSFQKLQSYGNVMIPAESGELASGLSGEGRMAEPENIITFIENDLEEQLPLKGKTILITAGPTYEAIDPVRFIGNHSSGKMGFDIADRAAALGAKVFLVSGPTHCQPSYEAIQVIPVVSSQEMYQACVDLFPNVDAAIAAAAVADYRPKNVADQKIKKSADSFVIELEKTKDILATLGGIKKHQILIGFALETENEIENAKVKIKKKNLDFIVLNSLQDEGAGFGKTTNKVTFIDKHFNIEPMELKSKTAVAIDIMDKVCAQLVTS
ncbi:MAG: bifunctional phosphopantothenoylcysteine decarboxylase/phosphopantothenate--cysteine ligase CoaBC [Flavobacterium sp.]